MTNWNKIVQPQKMDIRAITPVTGTASDTLTEVVSLDLRWLTDVTIVIANVDGDAHSLDYVVKVYSDYAAGISYEATTGTVTQGSSDQVILVRHAKAIISVKRTGGAGTDADYNISAIAGR